MAFYLIAVFEDNCYILVRQPFYAIRALIDLNYSRQYY